MLIIIIIIIFMTSFPWYKKMVVLIFYLNTFKKFRAIIVFPNLMWPLYIFLLIMSKYDQENIFHTGTSNAKYLQNHILQENLRIIKIR